MATQSSVSAFQTALLERFNQFSTDLDAVIVAIATKQIEHPARIGSVTKLIDAARDLRDYLPTNLRPAWLEQVYATGKSYLANPGKDQSTQFLRVLLKTFRSIQPIQFTDDEPPLISRP